MSRKNEEAKKNYSIATAFVMLLLVIFFMEITVMEVLSPLFARLDTLTASFVDALVLVVFYSFPLWFLVIRPLFDSDRSNGSSARLYCVGLLFKAIVIIFLVELLVMLFLANTLPAVSPVNRKVLDACLTILLCSPPLWWLLFRMKMRQRIIFLTESIAAPLKIYVLLLSMFFMSDLMESFLIPYVTTATSVISPKFTDSFLLTLFLSPFLWIFMLRPLKRDAQLKKARLEAVQAQVMDAIIMINERGAIESSNQTAERMFGYSAGEMIGKPVISIIGSEQQYLTEMIREATEGKSAQFPHQHREVSGCRLDGTKLILDVSVSRIMLDDWTSFLVAINDISDRKNMENELRESSQRFREIIEQTIDAIIFFKPGTCSIIDANHAAETLYGYSKSELKQAGLEQVCTPEIFARMNKVISSISSSDTSCLDDIANIRKDGTEIIVSIRAKMMTLQKTNIVYCSIRDVTKRIRLEEEARNMQAKLIQANKMTSLGLLVSGVAHEINNPNNFIMANAQLLSETWTDALKILREYYDENGDFYIGGLPFVKVEKQSQQLFAGIIEGARRINEIVLNLKGFARQERTVSSQYVDVNQVVPTAVSIIHHELIRYTENFNLDLKDGIPLVKWNSQQLGQVVINLLMNACQALPSRERGIWVATGFDASSGQVSISVRDEGGGISRDVRNRIMEPFFTTKLDQGGTGLGLSICHSIVKDNGGTLEFESEPGNGTTFVLRIPVEMSAIEENGK